MEPLTEKDIKDNIDNLTLKHYSGGYEGYAEYALNFPFKNKIMCTDVSRDKIKYKNKDGHIVEDIGFKKMMIKLCKDLKDKSFNLSQEYYDKLAETFTETELLNSDFNEAYRAISRYAAGRDNKFCNKMIKLISKGSIDINKEEKIREMEKMEKMEKMENEDYDTDYNSECTIYTDKI
jgi:hypothetical protein